MSVLIRLSPRGSKDTGPLPQESIFSSYVKTVLHALTWIKESHCRKKLTGKERPGGEKEMNDDTKRRSGHSGQQSA